MNIEQNTKDVFLYLIRLGIGTGEGAPSLPGPVDWPAVYALAQGHGLTAVLVDGIDRLPDSARPPKPLLMQWIGGAVQNHERRFEQCRRTLAEMAAFYREHGLRMMVLKGYACCLDWPRPEHRPIGDIDIWQFGQQKEADEVIRLETPELKSISFYSSQLPLYADPVFKLDQHIQGINVPDADLYMPIEEAKSRLHDPRFVIPYSRAVKEQMLDGKLTEAVNDRKFNDKIKAIVDKIVG